MRSFSTPSSCVDLMSCDIFARIVKRISLRCVLLAIALPCGCQVGPTKPRAGEFAQAHPISAPIPTEVHVEAIALVGPMLELTYINSASPSDGAVYAAPISTELVGDPSVTHSGRRIHALLSLSGPDAALARVARCLHAPENMTVLVDVFDVETGKRLTPSLYKTPRKWCYDASEYARTQSPRAAWEQTRATNSLLLLVLVLPVDLECPPSEGARLRISLEPMAAMFRAMKSEDVPVVVDTRSIEFAVRER